MLVLNLQKKGVEMKNRPLTTLTYGYLLLKTTTVCHHLLTSDACGHKNFIRRKTQDQSDPTILFIPDSPVSRQGQNGGVVSHSPKPVCRRV